jgi:ketopantoate reductase
MKSSMQRCGTGRLPEVDAIGGIARAADRYNIPVPVTTRLIDTVRRRAGMSEPT